MGISVAWAALIGQSTGAPNAFLGDVIAVAKRNLAVGEGLDGEGGFTVWGRLIAARDSLAKGAIPIGLANDLPLKNPIQEGQVVTWADVKLTIAKKSSYSHKARREMEAIFGTEVPALNTSN